MRAHLPFFFLIAFGAMLLFTGCRSMHGRRTGYAPSDGELVLHPANAALAEALANFGMGVLREGISDTGAVTNYSRTVELEPKETLPYLRIAALHIKGADHDQAIATMEECCERNPESLAAHLYLAQVCQALNRPDKAEKACLQAIAIAPRDCRGYSGLASVYNTSHDQARAFVTLEDALGKVDNTLPILRFMGDLHAQSMNTSTAEEASSHLKQGIRHYKEASLLPYDNLTPTYLHRLGDLYIINREIDNAIRCFNQVAIHEPYDIQVQKKLALCYMAVNDKENAALSLETVIGREPENAEVQYYLGELYEAMGDVTNAISSYGSACDATRANPLPYLKLSLLYLKTDPEKARLTLLAGLKRLPEDIDLLQLLARLYLSSEQNEEAISTFDRLRELVKKKDGSILDAGSFLQFGLLAQEIGLPDKAASFYEKGLELDPSSVELYVRLAFLYMNQDKKEQAVHLMEKATLVLPDESDTYYYLGLLNHRMERFAEAIQSFRKVEELAKQSPDLFLDSAFFFNYGAAYERLGDFENAEAMLQKSIELDTENGEAFNYLAYTWAERGVNLDVALDYVTHALDLDPENAAFIDTLGWVYYKQKEYELALAHIEEALYFMPDDPIIAEHLGDVLQAMNRKKEAMEWWKYSFRMNPANIALEDKLKEHGADIEELRRETIPETEPTAPR